jgi:hypothetical protein
MYARLTSKNSAIGVNSVSAGAAMAIVVYESSQLIHSRIKGAILLTIASRHDGQAHLAPSNQQTTTELNNFEN